MARVKHILIVEDEPHLREAMQLNFELEGYRVSTAITGNSALEKIRSKKADLIILDVMLPEVDGFTICETIRSEQVLTPILFLTAKNTTADRVKGLRIGGDDFLGKPFDLEELLLRVRNLLHRNSDKEEQITTVQLSSGSFDLDRFIAIDRNGNEQKLSKREAELLRLLTENEGQVVTRDEILEKVWGYNVLPSTRTVDNYILAFRKHFEHDPKKPKHFHSIRGVGYKLTI